MSAVLRRFGPRLLGSAGLLLLLSAAVYVGVDLLPGDPVTARLGVTASAEQVAQARTRLGLDDPVLARYGRWLADLATGDLGTSVSGRPVGDLLAGRLANSGLLAAVCLALLVPLSLGVGVWAGLRHGSGADRGVSAAALLLVSVPEFVVAAALILAFAVAWPVLPAVALLPSGTGPLDRPEVLVLPVLSLLLVSSAHALRVIRGAAAASAAAPHVECARLNGARGWPLVRRAVVPAVLPVAVQVWLVTGVSLIGGAVLVERVFGYPGLGEALVTAVQTGDLPVVQAIVLLLGGAMLGALLLADVALVLLTPRLRTGGTA
ncbi:ABC transporter permease [Pilimelia anulata]|uniref:ABC transporter permease n=1 Tax=Pilimelia anulata TaxID=53371 RepID=A0A8J3AZK6_9ACTN|nr:ABC transporter permease [Pilimelia anulata]GGJ74959.1 ABC transporter permease [Pilimelia anulata]